jgi:hypothetical protein
MTSQRYRFAHGLSGALGVFGLLSLLGASVVHAQGTPAAGAAPAPATGAAAPPAGAAAPAAAAPADTGAAAAAGEGGDSGAYTVRLKTLEKNVNELKEQIFRTKARLNLLKETVLHGVLGASTAYIKHKNEMGSSFRLVKAAYALDGVQIYSKSDDTGQLAEMSDFEVYNGAIQPGSHTLTVVLQYQGNGFGVFSYLKGYKFTAKSSQSFVASETKTTAITVVGYEKGNLTTQLADKPAIDFRINVSGSGSGSGTAAATKK